MLLDFKDQQVDQLEQLALKDRKDQLEQLDFKDQQVDQLEQQD